MDKYIPLEELFSGKYNKPCTKKGCKGVMGPVINGHTDNWTGRRCGRCRHQEWGTSNG